MGGHLVGRPSGQRCPSNVQPVGLPLESIIRERDRLGGERVRLDDVRARFEISVVDLVDQMRLRDAQQIISSEERNGLIALLLPPEVLLRQSMSLDHGGHGSVENEDALR